MRQLSLPDFFDDNGSHFNDPAFASNKLLPIHRWVNWIAGFSADFVRDVLKRYLPHRGTVLDPFCGVGTTLIEAVLLGHEAIGFEINPYADLTCRTKLRSYQLLAQELDGEITRFRKFYEERENSGYIPKSAPPAGFRTRSEFYSPQVLRKVLIIHDFFGTVKDQRLRDLFRLAFASTMVRYSNYSYEPSLGTKAAAGKENVTDFPVGQMILGKLEEMGEDITWFQENLPNGRVKAQVINDTFFKVEDYLEAASVDLIITSPPYLNNYHYNRNTRPQLYWLGYAKRPKDLKPLERSNFGKYWQTVRGHEGIELNFSLPDIDLAERLQRLGEINPEKGVYGGKGWANYAASYFNDSYKFAKGIKHTLKSGGVALVVLGNSILQGIMMPTDWYFGKIAESVGLELIGIDVPRSARVGNSIIQSEVRVVEAQESHQLYEAVVELRKR